MSSVPCGSAVLLTLNWPFMLTDAGPLRQRQPARAGEPGQGRRGGEDRKLQGGKAHQLQRHQGEGRMITRHPFLYLLLDNYQCWTTLEKPLNRYPINNLYLS